MPWKIKKNGCDEGWAVVKDDDSAEVVGCHPSHQKALAHQRALYANADKEDPEAFVNKELEEKGYYGDYTYVPWNVTSFAQLDQAKEQAAKVKALYSLGDQFQQIASNILYDSDIQNKGAALQALVNEYSGRIEDETTVKSLSQRILSHFRKEEPKKERNTGFLIWKETDSDQYRWFGMYSNNCEDAQGDIIAKEAHETFVELVDEGVVPYPELWFWHIPDMKMGTTDWMAESDGFVLATGLIDKEAEELALKLSEEDMQMSHGMYKKYLVRDTDDPHHIQFYVSKELSALPGWAAANKRTDFVLLKEETMFSDNKRAFLRDKLQLSDDEVAKLEGKTKEQSEKADSEGIQRKEDAVPAAETPAATEAPKYVTADELTTLLASALSPVIDAIGSIGGTVGDIQAEVKELKATEQDKVLKQAEDLPAASLESMLAERMFGVSLQQKSSEVTTTKTFAKPREAAVDTPGMTGISFIDDLVRKSQEFSEQS